jgi:uncharacterized protein
MDPTGDGLEVLGREQCVELLATASIGRVVFTDGGLPVVLPVTFLVDGNAIVFRARAESRLARSSDGTVLAFEVDDAEPALRVGWSVTVCGQAEAGPVPRTLERRLQAWAPGKRDVAVRIPLTMVSGRRIQPRPGGTRLGGDPDTGTARHSAQEAGDVVG